jgi:hypothetical protein
MQKGKVVPKRAIFTVLFGDYDELNELPSNARGDIDALCFTDDPALTSSTWTVVHVQPALPGDPIRSQRLVKILGNEILADYDETLYLDNSVVLTSDPREVLDDWLRDCDLAMPLHSFHETLVNEFDAVVEQQLDSPSRVAEQRSHYTEWFPDALNGDAIWTAMIARKNTSAVHDFQRIWAMHVLRYSRRDQLSVRVAIESSHVAVNYVDIDNHHSSLHSWPALTRRKHEVRNSFFPESTGDPELLLRRSEAEISHLKQELIAVWSSPSWKITRPLRGIAKLFTRPPKSG